MLNAIKLHLHTFFHTFVEMDETNLKSILTNHNLRITDCRLKVIQYFMNEKNTLSQGDLKLRFKEYDRVTLYRTINSFLASGILHKIPNETGSATYGLCHDTCNPDHHKHNHIHFKCNECGQIECLKEKQPVPNNIPLPKGYHFRGVSLIIDGVCTNCA